MEGDHRNGDGRDSNPCHETAAGLKREDDTFSYDSYGDDNDLNEGNGNEGSEAEKRLMLTPQRTKAGRVPSEEENGQDSRSHGAGFGEKDVEYNGEEAGGSDAEGEGGRTEEVEKDDESLAFLEALRQTRTRSPGRSMSLSVLSKGGFKTGTSMAVTPSLSAPEATDVVAAVDCHVSDSTGEDVSSIDVLETLRTRSASILLPGDRGNLDNLRSFSSSLLGSISGQGHLPTLPEATACEGEGDDEEQEMEEEKDDHGTERDNHFDIEDGEKRGGSLPQAFVDRLRRRSQLPGGGRSYRLRTVSSLSDAEEDEQEVQKREVVKGSDEKDEANGKAKTNEDNVRLIQLVREESDGEVDNGEAIADGNGLPFGLRRVQSLVVASSSLSPSKPTAEASSPLLPRESEPMPEGELESHDASTSSWQRGSSDIQLVQVMQRHRHSGDASKSSSQLGAMNRFGLRRVRSILADSSSRLTVASRGESSENTDDRSFGMKQKEKDTVCPACGRRKDMGDTSPEEETKKSPKVRFKEVQQSEEGKAALGTPKAHAEDNRPFLSGLVPGTLEEGVLQMVLVCDRPD